MIFYQAGEYQASCEAQFFSLQQQIQVLLPNARVEHIGASSIPMAVSKGDLDIFVGVESRELENAVKVLLALGFHEKVGTLRTDKLCMLESHLSNDLALQVVANGSEFECFLDFRNKLRTNALLVQQYNALKMSCAGWTQEEYRRKKSAFIEHVLALE